MTKQPISINGDMDQQHLDTELTDIAMSSEDDPYKTVDITVTNISPEETTGTDLTDSTPVPTANIESENDSNTVVLMDGSGSEQTNSSPQQVENIVYIHENPTPGEVIPWALLGGLIGCALGIAGWNLLGKAVRSRVKNNPKSMVVLTLQGLGARENQQDSLAATEPERYPEQGTLLCLADGMGGLKNGSMVSRAAVTAVINKFETEDKSDPERLVASLVQSATNAVNMLLSPNFCSSGTTLLIGYVREGKFYCASVGDSRICLLRDGKMIHLNRPHIYEDELMLHYFNGEASYNNVRNYEKKGGLTSFLGMGPLKYVDFPTYHVSIQRGDRFVLMSDGVFNTLSDEELAKILNKKPKTITNQLNKAIEEKKKRFQDNYSAAIIVVR